VARCGYGLWDFGIRSPAQVAGGAATAEWAAATKGNAMAGKGFAPGMHAKPVGRRARQNAEPAPSQTIKFVRGRQPQLPKDMEWHSQTRKWWAVWAKSELAKNFTIDDWQFLLDTALMHNAMWLKGQWTLAAEVRLRVAKFGQTPEDRARLRIVFADADERNPNRKPGSTTTSSESRQRRAAAGRVLKAVPDAS
jgi:hypothetical protein